MSINSTDLLRKGVTSEYFLVAFLKTKSAFGLGQIIQKRSAINPKNLYPHIDKLKDTGYVLEKDKKIYPNLRKLVKIINAEFLITKDMALTEKEEKFLVSVFENRQFFEKMSNDLIRTITRQKNRVHQIDALEIISDKIGFFASIFLLSKSMNSDPNKPQSMEEIKENFELMHEIWQQFMPQMEKMINYGISEILSDKKYVRKIPYIEGVTDEQAPEDTKKLKNEMMEQIMESKSQINQIKDSNKNKKIKQALPNIKGTGNDFLIIMESIPALKSFIEAPEGLLIKLSKLWKESQGFELVYLFMKMNKKN